MKRTLILIVAMMFMAGCATTTVRIKLPGDTYVENYSPLDGWEMSQEGSTVVFTPVVPSISGTKHSHSGRHYTHKWNDTPDVPDVPDEPDVPDVEEPDEPEPCPPCKPDKPKKDRKCRDKKRDKKRDKYGDKYRDKYRQYPEHPDKPSPDKPSCGGSCK